jgi:hypothetical protein
MSLQEVHRTVGVGQLKFMVPYALKLRNVEVEAHFNGEPYYHEFEPTIEEFPGMWDIVSNERPGVTVTHLHTPVGNLQLRHELLLEGVLSGTEPYLKEHLIKDEHDLKVVEFILEQTEFVPQFVKIYDRQALLGDHAFVVPLLHRIPFQQALLEYFGEMNLFFIHNDNPVLLHRLLKLLDEQLLDILNFLGEFQWPYVEFPDNLHGLMTNPKLFQEHCLPNYQVYSSILHSQGKKVGSHTDGELRRLLELLKESGLDVCESFSPYPLTGCTFQEAWKVWNGRPMIWGGIPSPILERTTSEEDFRFYMDDLFNIIDCQPVLLGVVDLFMVHNSIERVEYIAQRIEKISRE